MNFILREIDWPLINAAINLGRWICVQKINDDEKRKVIKLIEALNNLPEPSVDLNAEYGFRVVSEEDNGLIIERSWYVTMYPTQYAECMLEIFSTYCTDPRSDDVFDELDNELGFRLENNGKNFNHDFNFDRWIKEVKTLDVFKSNAIEHEIEVY